MREPIGPGRVLAIAYGFFALAAAARSTVQLGTHASRAPLAYALSATAALVYLLGAVLVQRADADPVFRPLVALLSVVELAGVASVGTWSLLRPSTFPDATVWSQFGSGYGFVPAVLPLLALWWVRRGARAGSALCRP